jgi:hypothetical protein
MLVQIALEIENGIFCAEITPVERDMCVAGDNKMILNLQNT